MVRWHYSLLMLWGLCTFIARPASCDMWSMVDTERRLMSDEGSLGWHCLVYYRPNSKCLKSVTSISLCIYECAEGGSHRCCSYILRLIIYVGSTLYSSHFNPLPFSFYHSHLTALAKETAGVHLEVQVL